MSSRKIATVILALAGLITPHCLAEQASSQIRHAVHFSCSTSKSFSKAPSLLKSSVFACEIIYSPEYYENPSIKFISGNRSENRSGNRLHRLSARPFFCWFKPVAGHKIKTAPGSWIKPGGKGEPLLHPQEQTQEQT